MPDYSSLLLGGKACTKEKKHTALKVARKVKQAMKEGKHAYGKGHKSSSESSSENESSSESEEEEEKKEVVGEGKKRGVKGMSYEERCKNLEKARATRMANLKKKTSGKGQYNQDYTDESQINYRGSPLDMYYQIPEKQKEEIRHERGENVKGKGVRKAKGKGDSISENMLEMGRTGGKIRGGDMSFMEHGVHAGMDMPTKEQFVKGGEMTHKPGRNKYMEEMHKKPKNKDSSIDIPTAIKNLAIIASKFGLKLVK
jgi:hypothetical protein